MKRFFQTLAIPAVVLLSLVLLPAKAEARGRVVVGYPGYYVGPRVAVFAPPVRVFVGPSAWAVPAPIAVQTPVIVTPPVAVPGQTTYYYGW